MLGAPERWPLGTPEAADLLNRAGQYDIDAARLQDLIDRGLLPAPGVGEDRGHEWGAADVMAASRLLETRHQWWPAPTQHDPKKHPSELALELARECGELKAVVEGLGGPRFDARHLLVLLVACDSAEARTKIASLLRGVLEVEHGITV